MFEANKKLTQQVAEVAEERDNLKQQLAAAVAERDTLDREVQDLKHQLAEKDSVAEVQLRSGSTPAATESAPPPDLPAIRKRVLADLRLGKQAPGYRAAAKALDAFEEALKGLPLGRVELPICAADLDGGDVFEKLREMYGTGPQKGRLPQWLAGLAADGQALPAILSLVAWYQQDPRSPSWETEADHIRYMQQTEEARKQNDPRKGIRNEYPHNVGIFD